MSAASLATSAVFSPWVSIQARCMPSSRQLSWAWVALWAPEQNM